MRIAKVLALATGMLLTTNLSFATVIPNLSVTAPEDGDVFTVDTSTTNIGITGSISPDNLNAKEYIININDNGVQLLSDADSCLSPPIKSTCLFNIPVELGIGEHVLQITALKNGDSGQQQMVQVTVTVEQSVVECDEIDPPAYANQYLNWLNGEKAPQAFAKVRGKVIREIAQKHAEGGYGSCTFNSSIYQQVEKDVNDALDRLLQ